MKEMVVTIPYLEKYLCLSDNAVINWIRGENSPTTERMYEICKKLNEDIKNIMMEMVVSSNL